MNALKADGQDHDAVWPASSMWISMGDTKHIVKDAASTSTTPIVFGIAKSKAVKLGWADDSGRHQARLHRGHPRRGQRRQTHVLHDLRPR